MNDFECWHTFQQAFYNSILGISEEYMSLPRIGTKPVLRERSYCYELHHQLRNHLPVNFPYLLQAEIDKSGQPLFREALGYSPNPDLVLHVPGTINNFIVMEVKCSRCAIRQAEEDIKKLTDMIENEKIHYQHGIFLVFGPDNQRESLRNIEIANPHITYIWHSAPKTLPELLVKGDWSI
jgi:hypothetical protein